MRPELARRLREAIKKDEGTSFIVDDNNNTYVRFDRIDITPIPSGKRGMSGRYQINIYLGDDIVNTIEVGPIFFSSGDSLTLNRIEGLFPLNIT